MQFSRRNFIKTGAIVAGGITFLPFNAFGANHEMHEFKTENGRIKVHPVNHASIVLYTPAGTIYVDPVGNPDLYAAFDPADLILITHEHGDHYNENSLMALAGDNTKIITNRPVYDMLPEDLKAKSTFIGNGGTTNFDDVTIDAIAAYNMTEERKNFHPKGRDNGYVLTVDNFRIYISGDTEDTPEMRALKNIDLAFVCMNLPFTMDAEAAASAVAEFKPTAVYPYHYQGRDDGTQDPAAFAELVGDAAEVKLGDW